MAPHSSILAWKIHGKSSLVGYSYWGHKESDMTEWLSMYLELKRERGRRRRGRKGTKNKKEGLERRKEGRKERKILRKEKPQPWWTMVHDYLTEEAIHMITVRLFSRGRPFFSQWSLINSSLDMSIRNIGKWNFPHWQNQDNKIYDQETHSAFWKVSQPVNES